MFTFEGMHNGEINRYPGTIIIPERSDGENFPITEPNLTNTVSTIMVLTTIAPGSQQGFAIGHSKAGLLCSGIVSQGDTGIRELAGLAKKLIDMVEEALPSLAPEEREYFNLLLKDAKENGLNMPFQGRIPLE